MATLKNTNINDTGYLKLPSGTTAQRPGSPTNGYIRWNTTESYMEVYDGITWREVNYKPTEFITDGLLLYLDASNPNCYPGTGTDVYDLSGKGANGVLSNGTSFVENGNASYFLFDGVNDFIDSTLSQNYLDVTIVFEPDFSHDDGGLAGIIAVGSGTEDKSLRFEDVDGTGPWSVASRNPGDANDWANPTATTYYVNNSVSNTLVSGWNVFGGHRTNQTTFPADFAYHLGTSSYPDRYFKGKIAAILMYNRQLSATEQETNFNYFKDRFGL